MPRTKLHLTPVLLSLLFAPSAVADVLYLDDDAASDPGPNDPTLSDPREDGSLAHPFDSIQEALDVASSGDELVLLDGTYSGPGNRDLTPGGKTLLVRGATSSASSVIDCEGVGRGFDLAGTLDVLTLRELTIKNGAAVVGAGLRARGGASPTLESCIFENNLARVHGGALYCRDSFPIVQRSRFSKNKALGSHGGGIYARGGALVLRNSLLDSNQCGVSGGGVYVDSCLASIDGCSLSGNLAQGMGGAIASDWSTTQIRGSVLWNDSAGLRIGPEVAVFHSSFAAAWCDVEGNFIGGASVLESAIGWASSNIDLDPLFLDPSNGDYHLDAASPCIDSGDPNFVATPGELDIDGQARVLSTFVDRGADEHE